MSQRNLSHEQLAMFMTPKEIMNRGAHRSELDDYHDEKDMWATKLDESHDWDHHGLHDSHNLHQDIANNGVQKPVTLSLENGKLTDGYHRIAAAHDIDPNMLVPVEHETEIYNPKKK